MEFSVREWTIIVGVLLIVAVFLDGYRRVRNERSNRIRVSLSKQVFNQQTQPFEEIPSASNPELPNGGARVIAKRNRDELQLRESVPVLIEPVSVAPPIAPPLESTPDDHSVTDADDYSVEAERIEPVMSESEEFSEPVQKPMVASHEDDVPEIVEPEIDEPEIAETVIEEAIDEPIVEPRRERESFFKRNKTEQRDEPLEEPAASPQEVLIINVLSKDETGFKGPDLLQLLLACDCRFGKMAIFHRYEKANGNGPVQFSVANLVEPGSFDLDGIDNFSTPGVCFFLTLPGPEKPVTAFNYMVETAQVLVRHLHAEMRDDAQSVMTAQTIEHCRQRIRDFERKQLTLQL